MNLRGRDIGKFTEMQMLSAKAIESMNFQALLNVWWMRDDKLAKPNLSDFETKHLVNAMLDAKGVARNVDVQTLAESDAAWAGWRGLHQASASCATLYKDVAFADKPGLRAAVNK
jgi:hypothetical protein